MNCHEATMLIAAEADGEADRAARATLAEHVRTCETCTAAQRELGDLRARLRAELPYHALPPDLRERILDRVRPLAPQRDLRGWRWFATGALGGSLATVLGWLVVTTVLAERARADLVQEAVAVHVRATASDHVIAVASSDQHTVKPWLSARLDYSPPVPRVDATGFTLVGGRLDYLDGRPVATLVYRHRDHVVDVFVRPARGRATAAAPRTIDGFNVVQARGDAMDWVVVSDVNLDALSAFVRVLVTPEAARQP